MKIEKGFNLLGLLRDYGWASLQFSTPPSLSLSFHVLISSAFHSSSPSKGGLGAQHHFVAGEGPARHVDQGLLRRLGRRYRRVVRLSKGRGGHAWHQRRPTRRSGYSRETGLPQSRLLSTARSAWRLLCQREYRPMLPSIGSRNDVMIVLFVVCQSGVVSL